MLKTLLTRLPLQVLAAAALTAGMGQARAQPLTICEIQYTTNTNGASPLIGQLVNCAGGVVVGKYEGTRPRVFLHDPDCPSELADPDCPDGWAGIQVKDWTWPYELYDAVQIGDWVSLTNVRVEEYVGVTFLQYQPQNNPGFSASSGFAVPPPAIVPVSDIPAPLELPGDEWRVENHDAECYESMRLIVRDVTVGAMDLGKAVDNYELSDPQGRACWAADYMNAGKVPWEPYHPFVASERHFCAVGGLFEQYTSGRFDYYQLVTLESEDLAFCGDANADGQVTLDDVPRFAECLTGPSGNGEPGGCDPPAWTQPPAELPLPYCLMMDQDYDGDVDVFDFGQLQTMWETP